MKYIEICQLLKDRLCSNEGIDSDSLIDRQYISLSCDIQSLSLKNPEKFNQIKNQILLKTEQKKQENQIKIKEIYEISRDNEQIDDKIDNKQELFHGTSSSNILGVLSRGLLVPNTNWYLKGSRRDVGMLGAGIYFTDDINSVLKYTKNENQKNLKQFLFIADVALGNIYETNEFQPSLVEPPQNCYNSVKGKKGNSFIDNEYVIYNSKQQKLKYLVEFIDNNDELDVNINKNMLKYNLENEKLENQLENAKNSFIEIENNEKINKIENEKFLNDLQVKENEKLNVNQDIGLISSECNDIPLKSSHIRVNLLDLVGTVEIYQEYFNDSDKAIEAKYIFPLDEKSAVCGFEAHINGKHIIGHVNEKQKARRRYRKAIEKGHGAYLMDQNKEKPDSWSVSVGNLPSKAKVIIKITYVTELDVEDHDIIFRFPVLLSGTQKKKISQDITQTKTESKIIASNDDLISQSFLLTFEMPFEILRMFSFTHNDNDFFMKSTDTKGTIQLKPDILSLGDKDFEFRITVNHVNQPRMWIEKNKNSHAAMICFYPKFEFSEQLDNEFIFLIDNSSSVINNIIKQTQIQRIMYLLLNQLPKQSYFNIISFGNTNEDLFFTSKEKNEKNLQMAFDWLQKISKKNLGGTDILKILKKLFLRVHKNRTPRNIFLLSDGEFFNLDSIQNLISNNSSHTRVFTCGIDCSSNRHSLYSISCLGRGSTEFFSDKGSQQFYDHKKIKNLYQKAIQPAVSNLTIDWIGTDNLLKQAPNKILSVFNGERKVIYGLFDEYHDLFPSQVSINHKEKMEKR